MNYLTMPRSLRRSAGLWRSLFIYYGQPHRERRLVRFYRTFIRPGDLCFDIGAHVGGRVRLWTRMGAEVVAVEPHPGCRKVLRKWYGDSPQVTLIEAATAAQPGMVTLHISERTPTVSSASEEWMQSVCQVASFASVRWEHIVDVPAITLDRMIERFGEPAFCKIDVEGYEYETLRGLSRPLSALSVEYVPAAKRIAVACVDRLTELGDYCFNWSVSEQHVWQSDVWLGSDAMRRVLEQMPAEANSGDIYARLRYPSIASKPAGR